MTNTRSSTPWWPVSVWEFHEVRRKLREIDALPKGQRGHARRNLAAQYGVSDRTLYRWVKYEVHELRCGKYAALFVVGQRRPSQVTPWERAA